MSLLPQFAIRHRVKRIYLLKNSHSLVFVSLLAQGSDGILETNVR